MFKKNSVVLRWFASYLLLLMIPLIISLTVYVQVENTLESEIVHSNELLLSKLRKELDDILDLQKRVCTQLAFDTNANELLSANIDIYRQWDSKQKVFNFIKTLSLSNGIIDNIYVYFHDANVAITTNAITDGFALYHTHYNWGEGGYEQWQQFIKGKFSNKYINISGNLGLGESGNAITFLRDIPITAHFHTLPSATIAVIVKAEHITNIMTEFEKVNGGKITILDEHGNVVLSNTDFNPLNSELKVGSDTVKTKTNRDTVISSVDSSVNSWQYVISIDKVRYWKQLKYTRILIYLYVLFTIIVGCIISAVFVKRNYAPVQLLLNKIKVKQTKSMLNRGDEYSLIFKEISNTIAERDSFADKYENQQTALRKHFLYQLLTRQIRENVLIEEYKKEFNIQTFSDSFMVALFYVEDYENLFADEKNINAELKYSSYQLIVTNIVEELVGAYHKCYVFDTGIFMAALINISPDRMADAKNDIVQAMKKGVDFIEEHFEILISVALSDVHQTYSGIPECYYEAYDTMASMQVSKLYGVIEYSDVKGEYGSDWRSQIEKEIHLTNFIKIGDKDGAKGVVEEFFHQKTDSVKSKTEFTRCLMFNLMTTMFKAIEGEVNRNEDFVPSEYFEKLFRCDDLMNIQMLVNKVIDELCDYTINASRERSEGIDSKVKKYIEERYHIQSFGVVDIGEHFGLTPSYISRLFKKESGEMLADYITRVRVSHAKELIREKNDTLDHIAQAVGYLNAKILARNFKRVEGILPSKYKEIVNKER